MGREEESEEGKAKGKRDEGREEKKGRGREGEGNLERKRSSSFSPFPSLNFLRVADYGRTRFVVQTESSCSEVTRPPCALTSGGSHHTDPKEDVDFRGLYLCKDQIHSSGV